VCSVWCGVRVCQYEEPTTFADVDAGDKTLDDTGGTVRTHENRDRHCDTADKAHSSSTPGLGLCEP